MKEAHGTKPRAVYISSAICSSVSSMSSPPLPNEATSLPFRQVDRHPAVEHISISCFCCRVLTANGGLGLGGRSSGQGAYNRCRSGQTAAGIGFSILCHGCLVFRRVRALYSFAFTSRRTVAQHSYTNPRWMRASLCGYRRCTENRRCVWLANRYRAERKGPSHQLEKNPRQRSWANTSSARFDNMVNKIVRSLTAYIGDFAVVRHRAPMVSEKRSSCRLSGE